MRLRKKSSCQRPSVGEKENSPRKKNLRDEEISPSSISSSPSAAISAAAPHASDQLLAWYRANRRALPWRGSADPYAVLVSEIMLQQTRVETVVPYYRRFLAAFPDVEALAAAPIDAVLARWSGLGYYSRARRLHQAAREIVARGGFPRTSRELVELPGIGAYSAAAVASIAFGETTPVVDGNVERVIARLLDLDADPARGPARRRVLDAAARLLDAAAPGDANQALMELGAIVCRKHRPRCLLCPLRDSCLARARGTVLDRPVRTKERKAVRERRVVVVARRGDRVLLMRNPERSSLLAGLWEFPWAERLRSRADWERALEQAYGGEWRVGARLGRARHGITFRALELEVYDAEVLLVSDRVAEGAAGVEPGWLTLDEIAAAPTTSMVGKVLACLARAAHDDDAR
jgi:A/G-specific adenine glycosylase